MQAAAPSVDRLTRPGIARGLAAGWPFALSGAVAGLLMGLVYRGLGLGWELALAFSTLVYSGTAQAVTAGMWREPLPIAAMTLAALAVSLRYLAMGAHLRQIFPGVPHRVMLPTLFLLGDAAWAMTATEAAKGRRDIGFLCGLNLAMAAGWIGGTLAGVLAAVVPPGPVAAAAGFLPLGYIAASLPAQWQGRATLPAWVVSAATAAAAVTVMPAGWAMLAGGAAGTAVAALRRDSI